MLLTFQGYFESGHFVSEDRDQIPEGRKAIVTILDESVDETGGEAARAKLWLKIISDIESCDEVLSGEPEPVRFKTPDEVSAL